MRNANENWRVLLSQITQHGQLVQPQLTAGAAGRATRELLGHRYALDMRYPVVTTPSRQLGRRFLAAEAAWILSGDNRVSTIKPFAKTIGNYSDDGRYFMGAYGPPVRDQLPYVIQALRQDPNTRQAVLTIWRPRPGSSKDVPCTVSLQWLLRDGKLHCVCNMRSSDAWLGVVYDQFNFSCLSAFVAAHLDPAPELGQLTFMFGSSHLYESHWEEAREALADDGGDELVLPLTPAEWASNPEELIDHLWNLATLPADRPWTEAPLTSCWLAELY